MRRLDRCFILGLYLFNLGTVSIGRSSDDLGFIAATLGVIIGGLLMWHSIEGKV